MKKAMAVMIMVLMLAPMTWAQKKEADRLKECGDVLNEILNVPEGIPQELIDKAECLVIFPSVKKVAVGFGASYGRGALICRGGADYTGLWGAPALYALEGLSGGFQLGGEATDFVLLVMNPSGARSILTSKVKVGVDASAAAGPKGRNAAAATDVMLKAEILSYSRSRGLFGGVSLEGSTLRSDNGANKNLYKKELSAEDIILGKKVAAPAEAKSLISLLNKKSPKNLSADVVKAKK